MTAKERIKEKTEENIEEKVVKKLLERGKKISAAESCTGGLVSQKLTSVPGSSGCLDLGVVTYANEQKTKILDVKPETLERFGAVSPQTALEMCLGIKKLSGADIGIGITGLAGPGGGSREKPVGLVYIGICTKDEHTAFKFNFEGERQSIREQAAFEALRLAFERI